MNEIIKKVNNFIYLEKGWYDGEGMPISQKVIDKCINFIEKYPELINDNFDVFPDVDGGILLTGNYEGGLFEIEFVDE